MLLKSHTSIADRGHHSLLFALSFSLGELRLLRAALEGVLCRLMRFGRLLMRGGPDLFVLFVLFGRL